jgi:colanic acid biosynthesis glycosyl transferase WcaI
LNILIVSQYFWPENFRINDLAVELKDRGHDVTVLTGKPNYPQGVFFRGYSFLSAIKETYKGVNIIRSPLIPRGSSKLMLAVNYLSFAILGSLTGLLCCRKNYDTIFVFQLSPVSVGIPAILIKKLTGAPIFFWIQDLWPESLTATGSISSPIVLWVIGKLVRFIYKRCDKILVSSKGYIEKIVEQVENPEKIAFFPQWAEPLFQSQNADMAKINQGEIPEGFLVMFAGNIGVSQAPEVMINAAEQLRNYSDIKWVIIGNGRLKDWMSEEVINRKLENNVFMLGSKPLETMPSYFSHADALLVILKKSSLFAMTIPAKVQSYMECGKPIIASLDGEGAELIIASKSGIVCPSDDSNALAESVLEMYKMSEDEKTRMGLNGKSYSDKHYNRERLINKLIADFQSFNKIN